jgi:hypothetical protein
MNIIWIGSLCPQKITHNRMLLFGIILLKHDRHFGYWNQSLEHVHARLLPRLSRSWTVLLPSVTYAKPITSITVVLLPFVTYLLTLSLLNIVWECGLSLTGTIHNPLTTNCEYGNVISNFTNGGENLYHVSCYGLLKDKSHKRTYTCTVVYFQYRKCIAAGG